MQMRVKNYMAEAGQVRRQVATNEWYALGVKDAPVFSRRMRKSERTGLIRRYHTFEPGRGVTPLAMRSKTQIKPLFVVKASNVEAARRAAEQYIDRLIADPVRGEHGTDLSNRFMAGGRRMISRTAWELYR
jgi:hypothetical protein